MEALLPCARTTNLTNEYAGALHQAAENKYFDVVERLIPLTLNSRSAPLFFLSLAAPFIQAAPAAHQQVFHAWLNTANVETVSEMLVASKYWKELDILAQVVDEPHRLAWFEQHGHQLPNTRRQVLARQRQEKAGELGGVTDDMKKRRARP